MDSFEGEKEFTFKLSHMESCYLNAAVVEFFHKMRAACELENPVPHSDDRYTDAKNLWKKVEDQIPIMDWK
jgi:hypothetical protein